MPKKLRFSCRCQTVRGHIAHEGPIIPRYVCYCEDCQAFMRHLSGAATEELDRHGGTEVVHVAPARLRLKQGGDQLRCLDLRGAGTLRWYAACCSNPIGSTPKWRGAPFVSLVRTMLRDAPDTDRLGPLRGRLRLDQAYGDVTALQDEALPASRMLLAIARMIVVERWHGRHRKTPFFTSNSAPVSAPYRLTPQDRKTAYGATIEPLNAALR